MRLCRNSAAYASTTDSIGAIEAELNSPFTYEGLKDYWPAARKRAEYVRTIADRLGITASVQQQVDRWRESRRPELRERAHREVWYEYKANYIHRAIVHHREEISRAYRERRAREEPPCQLSREDLGKWEAGLWRRAEEDVAQTLVDDSAVEHRLDRLLANAAALRYLKAIDKAVRCAVEGDERVTLEALDRVVDEVDPDYDGTELAAFVARRTAVLGCEPGLSREHLAHLGTSGITPQQAEAAGLWTEESIPMVSAMMRRRMPVGSYITFPIRRSLAAPPSYFRVKETTLGRKGYGHPDGVPPCPYFPPQTLANGWLRDAARPLIVTEGEKKGLLLDQLGYATIAVSGVWTLSGTRPQRGERWALHPWILEDVALEGREVVIAFDANQRTRPQVRRAIGRAIDMFLDAGAGDVRVVAWPAVLDERINGVDDLAYICGPEAVHELIAGARSVTERAIVIPAPVIEASTLPAAAKAVFGVVFARTLRGLRTTAEDVATLLRISLRASRDHLGALRRGGWATRCSGRASKGRATGKWTREPDTYRACRWLVAEPVIEVRPTEVHQRGYMAALVLGVLRAMRGDWVSLGALAEVLATTPRTIQRTVAELATAGVQQRRGEARLP